MKRFASLNTESLIITDKPSEITFSNTRTKIFDLLKIGGASPPIIITEISNGVFVLIDGNSRSAVLARYRLKTEAIVLTCNDDRNRLIELETIGEIQQPFPHRDFLMGQITLKQLKQIAIQHAQKYGLMTVANYLGYEIDYPKIDNIQNAIEAFGGNKNTKQYTCIVVYDENGPHYLPIEPKFHRMANKSGYEVIKVNDRLILQKGLSWAKEHKIDQPISQMVKL